MQQVVLPSGEVVEFPGDMSDADITAAIKALDSQGQTAPEGQSTLGGVLDSFTQGASFGFGDELTAAEKAIPALFDDRDFSDLYSENLAKERGQQKRFADENPVLATGSEIAGGVAAALTPLGAAGQVVSAPMKAANVGKAATAGAGYGGLYGFGSGEGGAGERLEQVPGHAATGVLGGVVGAPIQAGVGKLSQKLAQRKAVKQAGKAAGVSRPAYDLVRNSAQTADADIAGGAVKQLQAGGPDAMLGDIMPGPLDYVANVGGGAPIARQNLGARVDRATARVDGAIDSTLGPAVGVKETARKISTETADARNSAYAAAYNTPISYETGGPGERILGILDRVPPKTLQSAIDEANEAMVEAGARNQQILISIGDDGDIIFNEMPNVQQLDEIKKALQGHAREAVDQFGRKTARGSRADRLAKELRDALGDAAPEYNAATAAGADKIAQDQALEMGRLLLSQRMTVEDATEAGARMQMPERVRAAQGVRAYLKELMGNVRRTRTDPNTDQRAAWQAIQSVLTDNNQAKLSAVLGDAEAGKLFGELEQAARAFGVRASAAGNSATAGRQAMDTALNEGVAGIGRAPSNMPRPNIMDAALSVPGRVYNAATGNTPKALARTTDQARREMAELLTGLRGPAAIAELERMLSVNRMVATIPATGGRLSRRLASSPRLAAAPALSPLIQGDPR